jgi:hypothetical protein
MKEFEKVFSKWRRQAIPWGELYPNEANLRVEKPDLIDDLMHLDMGVVYNSLLKQPEFGSLPLMASCSRGQLGNLNAESFCERILSCVNTVVTPGNTLLSDEEIEMIVVLRMNRKFMKFMRMHYSHLAKPHLLDASLFTD